MPINVSRVLLLLLLPGPPVGGPGRGAEVVVAVDMTSVVGRCLSSLLSPLFSVVGPLSSSVVYYRRLTSTRQVVTFRYFSFRAYVPWASKQSSEWTSGRTERWGGSLVEVPGRFQVPMGSKVTIIKQRAPRHHCTHRHPSSAIPSIFIRISRRPRP